MKTQLLSLMVSMLTLSGALLSQTETSSRIALPSGSTHPARSFVTTKSTVCGVDTIVYPYLKELTLTTVDSFFVDAMVGNVRTSSQAYHITEPVSIHGVQFWGGAYSTSTAPQTLQVRAYLYSVDGNNMPVTPLDSADVTVTNTYDFYEAVFPTPYVYGQNFAVAVRSVPIDTLAVITNNADNFSASVNYGEGLAWRRFGSGVWNSSQSFFGQDLEYMIFPIVSYDITAAYVTDGPIECEDAEVEFDNVSSSHFSNRMLNLYAFDEYWGFAAADSSFTWNYDDAGAEGFTTDGSHTFGAEGTYEVSLTGDMLGYYTSCSDTYSDEIEVIANPVAATSATGALDLCAGGILTLHASPASDVAYQWLMDGAAVADSTNGTLTVSEAGNYAVIATNVCDADTSAAVTVSIITAPSAGVNASGPLQFCEGESVELTATPSSGVDYEWLMNGDTVADEQSSGLTVTENGSYKVVTSNVCGSDTSLVSQIWVDEPITATLNVTGSVGICAGGMFELSAEADPDQNVTYVWHQNGFEVEDETSSSLNVTEGGEYAAIATNSCGSDTTDIVTVTVNPLPAVPVITASGAILISSPAGGVYQWYLGGEELVGEMNDSLTVTQNGDYSVSVTDANGCSSVSAEFQVAYISVTELVNDYLVLYPNPSDGQFTIKGKDNGTLEITTTEGKLILSQKIDQDSETSVDLSAYGSAVYFVRLSGEWGVKNLRAVVRK